MKVDWETIKAFAQERKVSIQWVEKNDHYFLTAIDGPFKLTCGLYQNADDQSAIEDFEENFKSIGNRSPKTEVLTRLEKNDRSKRYIGFSATATKNASTSFFLKAPGSMSYSAGPLFQDNLTNDRLVFGGWAWGENVVNGDYLKIDAVDHENVLGLGVDAVLKSFNETATVSVYPDSGDNAVEKVNGIFLHPEQKTEIASPVPTILYGGIWLRITYVSVGTVTNPKIFVNLNWEKQNSL